MELNPYSDLCFYYWRVGLWWEGAPEYRYAALCSLQRYKAEIIR